MTYVRRKERRPRIYKFIFSVVAAVIVLVFVSLAHAQGGGLKLFKRDFTVGGRLPGTILLVGLTKDSRDIEKLFGIVIGKAQETYSKLDGQNPASEVSEIVSRAGAGAIHVSENVLGAFEAAKKISDWTNGAFDIAFAGEGNWRDVKIDSHTSSVEIKRNGMKISFDPMINGFMAEFIARLLFAANMQNAVVKVGNVFRGIGNGPDGPWKVEIQDDEGTFAHRALNLTLKDMAVAAISRSQFRAFKPVDPRSKKEIDPPCRGTVNVMADAALAEGIANAVFILGPDEGMKLLKKVGKGMIVDNAGNFLRSPGF